MCTLDPGCNIPTLSHLIKYLYSKLLTRAMSLNVLIDINCGYQKKRLTLIANTYF